MSASRERKKRMAQEQQAPVQQTTKKKKKLSEGWIFAICMLLILAIVFGTIGIYRAYWTDAVVVTVGDHEITTGEFGIYYTMQVNQMSDYLTYMGVSTTESLKNQVISESNANMLGLFGYDASNVVPDETTWAEFFARQAMLSIAANYGVYEKALEAGYTLPEGTATEADQLMATMELTAMMYGTDLEGYLEGNYGKDCDEETYRHYIEVNQYYQYYATQLRTDYTQDELTARYTENKQDFDSATFYLYRTTAKDFLTEEDGENAEVTAEHIKQAEEEAKAMVENFDVANAKVSLNTDTLRANLAVNTTETAANWLFDQAADGDVQLFEKTVTDEATKEETKTWFVLKLVDKDNYDTVNVLSIYVANEDVADDAAPVEGANAETVRAALQEDASEESFRRLLSYNEGNGGELVNVARYQFAGYPEIYEWLFDASRKEGDSQEFTVSGGVYFFYYTGLGETYLDNALRNTLINEWMEEVVTAAQESCVYDEKAAMHAHVGLFG